MQGLDPNLKVQLVSKDFPTFQHMVNKALVQEDAQYQLQDSRKRKMAFQTQYNASSSRLRMNPPQFNKTPTATDAPRTPGSAPRSEMQEPYIFTGVRPQKSITSAFGVQCFRCHEMGHYAGNCPQKPQVTTPIPFNLGNTPARTPVVGQGRGVSPTTGKAPRTPQSQGRGRVNNITTKGAPGAAIMLGKFQFGSKQEAA